MNTADAIRAVLTASSTVDLFGTDQPARRYHELARALHPDVAAGPDATAAFVRLARLWEGRHGTAIRTKLGEYRLTDLRYRGDLADLYAVGAEPASPGLRSAGSAATGATREGGAGQARRPRERSERIGHSTTLLKLPRSPANNDLMEREAVALRTLEEVGDPRFLPYVPRLVETFRHRDDATGADRHINVLGSVPGLHSLVEVRDAYPGGLDPRDAAWMWRRLLVAVGFAHRGGLVHGAVLPTHVLIEPGDHGLVLVDWCYSVLADEPVPALVPEYADWYPAEVHKRQTPGPGTDIAMVTRCMTWLMGPRIPDPLRSFAAGCALASLAARPDDAWRLLDELDGVLVSLYGPRRFRPFRLDPVS